MKKALVSILAILYLAVASGVEINIHYCMGEVSSVAYGGAEEGPCSKCGMESKKGCCEDESTFLKIQDSHQVSQLSWALQVPAVDMPDLAFGYRPFLLSRQLITDHPSNGPPPGISKPIYLRNCVFRI